MAKWIKGFSNIKVTLLNYENDLAEKAFQFGRLGEFFDWNTSKEKVITQIINNKTFPKFVFEGTNVAFRIEGISRICLAQLTREKGFFCSASGDVRPLTMEHNIPLSIYNNKKWMQKLTKIQIEIEKLYINLLENNIPYMDARYIGLHSQIINLTYNTSIINFLRSCNIRTENGFADEISMVYRKCLFELKKAIFENKKLDKYNKCLWTWLFNFVKKTKPYLRDHTYNNDFKLIPEPKNYKFDEPAHNDWRKSGWKKELENMLIYNPDLLMSGEREMILKWKNKKRLNTTFDENGPWAGKTLIKKTDYWKKHKLGVDNYVK